MPISADRFDDLDEGSDRPKPGTNADDILSFLEAHPDQAFTRGEIVEGTGVTSGSVGPTLARLRDAGRVDHKGRYWRVSDHVRSLDAAVGHAGAVAASQEEAQFDYAEWQEHAVDPREARE